VSKKNIPTDEDFRRAEAAERERNRGLSQVRDALLHRFTGQGLHEVFVFFSPKTDSFGAFVFYRLHRHVEEARESGLEHQIRQAVFEELENVGRGRRDTLSASFEFDSDENVQANFEGDYFLRLR
jgi:hypothetical protein